MLTPQHIWLAREPVDMRRGIDTLTQYITDHLHQPRQGDVAWILSPEQADWLMKGIDWQRVEGLDLTQWK
ncbi:IS66 family insertion sequence element accessory protein TnpB [Serratia fonticola]|uniref:IS66 family insertion sequence element accessory protein TnpB n=1 Tax=Serratia fonticola TaxID=47917 RepID=UPI00192C8EC1|nr:IS66 family insertion sequence element accessory protein TnpB [Serratia fonticola]MBL5904012.1 IS66 family insertion sequence element accessory protein TnpB [Serratia fonticola]